MTPGSLLQGSEMNRSEVVESVVKDRLSGMTEEILGAGSIGDLDIQVPAIERIADDLAILIQMVFGLRIVDSHRCSDGKDRDVCHANRNKFDPLIRVEAVIPYVKSEERVHSLTLCLEGN